MSDSSNSGAPNIFTFATKELSQDAMICWLISWAGQTKSSSLEDEELRRCGLRFVRAFLNHSKGDRDPVNVEAVFETEIHQQERGIDVLARINGKHVLLIEDKTVSKNYANQLSRYYSYVVEARTKLREVPNRNLYPIFLKTGNQSLANDRRVEKRKFKVFSRTDFLDVLNGYKGHNSILLDFREHLQDLENRTDSYIRWTSRARRESWWAWEGFYRRLERGLEETKRRWTGWGYVPNKSGGFLGFWWWPFDTDNIYLQIEARFGAHVQTQAKLCFKVDSAGKTKEEQQDLKWKWHGLVMAAGENRVMKPRVMRIGNTMTVAWWQNDWMAFGEGERLDIFGTIENLKQAEAVLRAAVSASV